MGSVDSPRHYKLGDLKKTKKGHQVTETVFVPEHRRGQKRKRTRCVPFPLNSDKISNLRTALVQPNVQGVSPLPLDVSFSELGRFLESGDFSFVPKK
jgi:hypothetical protein